MGIIFSPRGDHQEPKQQQDRLLRWAALCGRFGVPGRAHVLDVASGSAQSHEAFYVVSILVFVEWANDFAKGKGGGGDEGASERMGGLLRRGCRDIRSLAGRIGPLAAAQPFTIICAVGGMATLVVQRARARNAARTIEG